MSDREPSKPKDEEKEEPAATTTVHIARLGTHAVTAVFQRHGDGWGVMDWRRIPPALDGGAKPARMGQPAEEALPVLRAPSEAQQARRFKTIEDAVAFCCAEF